MALEPKIKKMIYIYHTKKYQNKTKTKTNDLEHEVGRLEKTNLLPAGKLLAIFV